MCIKDNLWEKVDKEVYRRPYMPGESLSGIYVDKGVKPEVGAGYVYSLPDHPTFQWYTEEGGKTPAFPEKHTVAVLSTTHVTEQDMELIKKHFPCDVMHFYVEIPVDKDYLKDEGHDLFVSRWVSRDFVRLYKACIQEKVDFLRLDMDGPVSPDFPTFDW